MNFDQAFELVVGHEEIESAINNALYEESNKHRPPESKNNKRDYDCSVDNCSNPAYAKKLCNAHYLRMRSGKDLSPLIRCRTKNTYCIECGEEINSHGGWGRCSKHYKALRTKVVKEAIVKVMGGECLKCNQEFPSPVYDFHHLSDKKFSLGEQLINYSISKIAKEAAKCVLLCANCHRLIHYGL